MPRISYHGAMSKKADADIAEIKRFLLGGLTEHEIATYTGGAKAILSTNHVVNGALATSYGEPVQPPTAKDIAAEVKAEVKKALADSGGATGFTSDQLASLVERSVVTAMKKHPLVPRP